MLPDGRRLGAHLPLATGMRKAVERAREIGASAMQIWADNPTAWQRRAEPPTEQAAFRELLRAYDIRPVATHASYLVNLAGPDPVFYEGSIRLLAAELRDAPAYGSSLVNVHIGSHKDTGLDQGIERVAEGVARTLAEVPDAPDDANGSHAPILLLENSAGSGFGVGTSVDELARIAEAIDRCGVRPERVGYCLDLAHAWAAGIDIGGRAAVDRFFGEFDERIGLDRLRLVHLNDSKSERGSRLDRHEHLGAGRIGIEGIRRVLTHPRLGHVAYLLETPGMDEGYDAINLDRAQRIARGKPLPTLPPEAFRMRSARARSAPPA